MPPTAIPATPSAIPIPCDRAQFVSDISIKDGTSFTPGASFVKTWRLKNVDSCTWTNAYALVFSSEAKAAALAAGADAFVDIGGMMLLCYRRNGL